MMSVSRIYSEKRTRIEGSLEQAGEKRKQSRKPVLEQQNREIDRASKLRRPIPIKAEETNDQEKEILKSAQINFREGHTTLFWEM